VTKTDDSAASPEAGQYDRYRQQIDDPSTREALLRQVRGTVQGLGSAYLVHLVGAILGIVALVLIAPGGFLQTWRDPLIAGLLLTDLVAYGGLRSVAVRPARWLLPLLVLDLVIVLGLTLLSAINGEFSIAWLLLLVFPLMLFVHRKDARDIAALLAEHAAWRKQNAES
jgi:hypothetical protein